MCDCMSVVNVLDNYFSTGEIRKNLRGRDLWDEIFHMMDGAPANDIKIQWMPSHLAEKGNEVKREKYLSRGTVVAEDILGNDGADDLAKSGACKHTPIGHIINAAADRRTTAIIFQKMYVHIWDKHLQGCDQETLKANAADMEEMHRMMLATQSYDAYDDDYDPFSIEEEPVHTNSNHEQPAHDDGDIIKIPTENVYERYPAYGW